MFSDDFITILDLELEHLIIHLNNLSLDVDAAHIFSDNEGVELYDTLRMIDAIERLKNYANFCRQR